MTSKSCGIAKLLLPLLGAGVLLLAMFSLTQADVAPPDAPPGSNIGPGGSTQVQMVAEQVLLDARPLKLSDTNSVQVSAVFTMCNEGQADEHLQVRFPLVGQMGYGWQGLPQVQNFTARVNDKLVATTAISAPVDRADQLLPWAAFDVTFPISRNVIIRVSYAVQPSDWGSRAVLSYILETGAGWYGPIGVATVVLRLPYTATAENVSSFYRSTTQLEFVGQEVRLHWMDLEPTQRDNVKLSIVWPTLWQKVFTARAAVTAKPENAQAWMNLASAYQDASVDSKHFASPEFSDLAVQAARRAVALEPQSATRHAELAWVLWWTCFPSMDA